MRNLLICLVLFCGVFAAIAEEPVPAIAGDWTLVLDENFDTLDKTRWSRGLANKSLRIGSSKAFYVPENVSVENGQLIITSKKEKLKLKDKRGKKHKTKYTSGYLQSFGKVTQRYGYFEAKIKMPRARGLWPAFWLMPDRKQGTVHERKSTLQTDNGRGMEIDIVEHLTEWGQGKYHYAAHWDGYQEELQSLGAAYKFGSSDEYRKFGLYWNEGILIWYLDGVEIHRWKDERVADVPMYMILNTAIGGWATSKIDTKSLPAETVVDYVRLWSGTVQESGEQQAYTWQDAAIKLEGKWKAEDQYINDRGYWARKERLLTLTLEPDLASAGTYAVYAKWPEHKKASTRTSFVVGHALGTDQVIVDQAKHAGYWYKLGDFNFEAGKSESQYVLLENKNADGYVVFSEIKFEANKMQ